MALTHMRIKELLDESRAMNVMALVQITFVFE